MASFTGFLGKGHASQGKDGKVHISPGQAGGKTDFVPGVTADSTLWTADTICVTADGRVVCIPANVVEGVRGPTADTTLYTADNTILTADGGVVAGGASDSFDAIRVAGGAVISADILEAADAFDQADAIGVFAADALEPVNALDDLDAAVGGVVIPADVAETAAATDSLDAVAFPAIEAVPGGAHYPRQRRPLPVYGYGYGILPQLWGEAHGVVGTVAKGAAQFFVGATAIGACGQAGNAAVVLKGMAVMGQGAVGARGSGQGVIVKFSGSATGRHDDDEAAVIAILLAA